VAYALKAHHFFSPGQRPGSVSRKVGINESSRRLKIRVKEVSTFGE